MKYVYYTQTKGFEEQKVSLFHACNICKRIEPTITIKEIKEKLHDPYVGEVIGNDIRVWSEEA